MVTLPDWFEALNKDYRYHLTTIGQPLQAWVASEIARGAFVIRTGKANSAGFFRPTGLMTSRTAATRSPIAPWIR